MSFGLKECPAVNVYGSGDFSNQMHQFVGCVLQLCLDSVHFAVERISSKHSIPFGFQVLHKTATFLRKRF